MTCTDIALPARKLAEAKLLIDKKLMRTALLMLAMMATAFGAATWDVVQEFSIEIRAIPVVLFVVVCIIVAQMYASTSQVAEPSASATVAQQSQDALTSEVALQKATDAVLAKQLRVRGALQDLRTSLEILTAVNVLEGSDKDEVERLLVTSLATLHRSV